MSLLVDTIMFSIPANRKKTPSGWTSFNAPCCYERGHKPDTRKRGGIIQADDGISYHCFNCGFKASWQPGRPLSRNMKLFMQWINISDDDITKISFDILRQNENADIKEFKVQIPQFETVDLPPQAVKIADVKEVNDDLLAVLEYMADRCLNLDDTDYYWSPHPTYKDKLIVPFYHEGRIVGYITRVIQWNKNQKYVDKPKYMQEVQPGFVFNLDEQRYNKAFCIVCEGPLDAIHVEGCALLGASISKQQEMLLKKLNKPIIYVPDRDYPGRQMMMKAMQLGWQISMPDWQKDCKDINDAVKIYGRLYTLHSIVSAAEESEVKIKLRAKTWFSLKNI